MIFSVLVEVQLRPGIADPQGATIERSLPTLGFDGVHGVRVGKAHPLRARGGRRGGGPRAAEELCAAVPHQPGDRGRRRRAPAVEPASMSRPVGVVLFPGSNCEHDVVEAIAALGGEAEHRCGTATATVGGVDAVVVPGGFAHGDYLRPGAIARFSPVMDAVADFAADGRPGRRHLQRLPGAHRGGAAARRPAEEPRPEVPLHHGRRCGWSPPTRRSPPRPTVGDGAADPDQPLRGQLHVRRRDAGRAAGRGPGRLALRRQPQRLDRRHRRGLQRGRNVVGLMPHPERASHALLGSTDGLPLLRSLLGRGRWRRPRVDASRVSRCRG